MASIDVLQHRVLRQQNHQQLTRAQVAQVVTHAFLRMLDMTSAPNEPSKACATQGMCH
jgi:hypothetical protein